MRIAAIDIGTNSVHMIVVQVRADLSFEIVDREKEMVRLGAGGLGGRALTPEAMTAALQALSKFRRLADSHRVDDIVAAATSATREAENGGEFLARIERETGIRARIISGIQEARLIHRAAVYGVGAGSEPAVVIDVGGGSVEITLGTGGEPKVAKSFKLGVLRLTDEFVRTDPLTKRGERKLVKHIRAEIGSFLQEIRDAGFTHVIGTSGTILNLGLMATDQDAAGRTIRNLRVPVKQLHKLRKRIVSLDMEDRLRLPRLEPARADLIVAGAILVDTVMENLGAEALTLCDLALREGLVLDYIRRNRVQIAHVDRYPDVRRRSAIELAERCNYWREHAQQVARLALSLFDQARDAHGLTGREREWLEFAALLHDIGVHISYTRHHKHSYYLVKNGDLRGFEPEEVDVIALVTRYHRRAPPKRAHPEYRRLPTRTRRAVRILASILRLAESLDRSHAQVIEKVKLTRRRGEYTLQVRAGGDAELEVWAAHRHLGPFQAMLGAEVRVEARVSGTSYAQQTDHSPRISRQAVRRRRDRRLGKDDSARAAREVAGRSRTSGIRHRMELVSAR